MNKCYIASGWFSPEWLAELESLGSEPARCEINLHFQDSLLFL